jgi:predicted amidohydrolase YtcJ
MQDTYPTLILHNGRVLTVDADFSVVQAVAVAGQDIASLGSDRDILALAGPQTQIVDLQGKTVIPGLIDSHLHLQWTARNITAVDLLGAGSIAGVQKLISEAAEHKPRGEWIIGSSSWHESLLEEGRLPRREELDEAAPEHPVFIPRGGHVGTANSRALALAGIDASTPNPYGGVIVRDVQTGEATGVLLETAVDLARRILPPPPSEEVQREHLRQTMRKLNSFGLVGVMEPGLDVTTIRRYERLADDGHLTIRTDLMFRANSEAETLEGLKASARPDDEMLRFVGIKYMLDGGVEGARLSKPYELVPGEQTDPEYRGLYLLPPGGEDEFVNSLLHVARAGLQVQCHGVGDDGIDLIIRSYERVNAVIPIRNLNWTVMHIQLPRPDAFERMVRIGVMATAQDHSVLLGHNMRRWWGEERAAYSTPLRAIIDAGVHVGGGTDAPILPISPFISMWWMVTRRTLQGYQLGPEYAITAREALTLYTINNAVLMGVDKRRGSLETGKLADMVVLSQDMLQIDPEQIRDVEAVMTILGGRIVFQRESA